MLHRLAELDGVIREAYAAYDYKRVVAVLSQFMNTDLSAFYVDIRKDALYCEPYSSKKRQAALETIEQIFRAHLRVAGAAHVLHRRGGLARPLSFRGGLGAPGDVPQGRRVLAQRGAGREVGEGQARAPRRHRRAGDRARRQADRRLAGGGAAGVHRRCRPAWRRSTASIWRRCASPRASRWSPASRPRAPSRCDDVAGVGVVCKRAEGKKCARSWRITEDVGSDPDFPELSARDAKAVREYDRRQAAT